MYCTHLSVRSAKLWATAGAMRCASRLYAHVCMRRTIQRTCVAHDARSHTHQASTRSYIPMHTCMPTYQIQKRVHALHVYLPSFIPVHNAIGHTIHKLASLMRAGYVLRSPECLECGVVGQCCSNVLRSLIAYGGVPKPVRTCVCAKADTAHVRCSRCAIPFIQPRAMSYTLMRTCMPIPNTNTRACLARIPTFLHSSSQRNSI
jgi:hypothetical protein